MRIPMLLTKTSCTFLFCAAMAVSADPDFSMTGYATVNADGISTTTGGGTAAPKQIRTLSELESWADSRERNTTPEVVQICGKITASPSKVVTIKHGANISIIGQGTTAELDGVGLVIWDYKNVIVRYLKIHEVRYPNDALTLDEVNHAWVDHCEFYSKIGAGIGQDTYDGLLDIKSGARWITVSWCYLHHHMKCLLIGHTDNTGAQAEDSQIRVTIHHTWFDNTDGRNPSVRFGAAHVFNCYFNAITDYGIASRVGAHVKVDNCHFNNVKLPMSTDKFPISGLPMGYILQAGNKFTGTNGASIISQPGADFWTSSNLPYQYTLEDVQTVEATVKKYAGFGNNSAVSGAASPPTVSPVRRTVTVEVTAQSPRKAALSGEVYDIGGRRISRPAPGGASAALGVYIVRPAPANVSVK